MMLSISYVVYSVNYLIYLLIATRTIRLENIALNHVSLGFTVYNNHMHVSLLYNNHLCPRILPWSQVVIDHKSQAT